MSSWSRSRGSTLWRQRGPNLDRGVVAGGVVARPIENDRGGYSTQQDLVYIGRAAALPSRRCKCATHDNSLCIYLSRDDNAILSGGHGGCVQQGGRGAGRPAPTDDEMPHAVSPA
jgi:hypothetical protein